MADDGTQLFNVEDASGHVIGSFNAYDTITGDFFGSYTEAALVTKDLGTVANDPGVGSIFNTMYYLGAESVYSDVTSASGNLITDTIITPFGNFDIPTTFDAALVETTSAIDLPGGDQLDPVGALDYTGVNGLPPVDAAVQVRRRSITRTPTARPALSVPSSRTPWTSSMTPPKQSGHLRIGSGRSNRLGIRDRHLR